MALRGFKMKQTVLGETLKNLRTCRADLKEREKEQEADPDVENDTKWVNEYYNLKGYIEALEFVINTFHRLDKKKKK